MKRIIKNVGILDLRTTKDESILDIARVENVGLVIYSPETAHIMSMLNFVNLGTSVETTGDFHMLTGQITLRGADFRNYKEPVNLLITGQVIIKEDMEPEDVEKGIANLIVTGQIICPEKVAPAIHSKLLNMTGQTMTYTSGAKVVIGKLKIDHNLLKSLESPASFSVIGKVDVTSEFPPALLDEKIDSLEVMGKVITREEYMEVLYRKLKNSAMAKIQGIPRGYVLVDRQLIIDSISIRKFGGDKLYALGEILIQPDVTPQMMKEYISSMRIEKRVICPENLKEAVLDLSDEPSPELITYTGKLIIIDGEHILTPEELEYASDRLTYIIKGSMEIDSEVDPKIMMSKIEYIDNFGEIRANTKQYGVLQLILRTKKGEIRRTDKYDMPHGSEAVEEFREMGNIGSLKL